MSALTLTMTSAGLARFTAAQLGQGIDLRIAAVALSDSPFVAAPTLTAVPGEFRRVATISGQQVGNSIVHLMLRDDAAISYSVRGFGLFLSDGTLFATYAQADRIMQKATLASTLLALDIAFPAGTAAAVSFGDTNFLNPPATSTTKGVVELADEAESLAGLDDTRALTPKGLTPRLLALLADDATAVAGTDASRAVTPKGLAARLATLLADDATTVAGTDATRAVTPKGLTPRLLALLADDATAVAGTDASRAVTPKGLAARLTTLLADDATTTAGTDGTRAVTPKGLATRLATLIAGYVTTARRVVGGGLVTGGGALSGDLTLTVTAASAAEADAGALTTKVLTPASLVNILAAIADRVRGSRLVSAAGLATGGGALTGDVTITVTAATGVQLRAGTATTVVPTPKALADAGAVYVVQQALQATGGYRVWSDGLKECWGSIYVPANTTVTVGLPIAHTSFVAPAGAAGAIAQDEQMLGILNVGLGGFDVRNRNPLAATYYWHTKGL